MDRGLESSDAPQLSPLMIAPRGCRIVERHAPPLIPSPIGWLGLVRVAVPTARKGASWPTGFDLPEPACRGVCSRMLLVSPAGLGLVGGTVRSSQDAKREVSYRLQRSRYSSWQTCWRKEGQRQRFPVILNLLGSRQTLDQQIYSSEVRARLKITVTVQGAHFARTFL